MVALWIVIGVLFLLIIGLVIITLRLRQEQVHQCEKWDYKVPKEKDVIFEGENGEDVWVIKRERDQLLTGKIINGQFKKRSAI